MALSKSALEAAILAAIQKSTGGVTQQQFAADLAAAIDAYVKAGQVVIGSGSSSGTYPVT